MWEFIKGAGFITPGFVRKFLADKSGMTVKSMRVRIWSAAIFYGCVGFLVATVIFGHIALQ